jgi:hypothetical protein
LLSNRRSIDTCFRGSARILVASALIFALLATTQRVSISVGRLAAIATDLGADERFPCEGCACGCASAEHCWTNCCCHPLVERVAWARSNGVKLPPSVARMLPALLAAESRHPALPACCKERLARLPAMSALECHGIAGWLVPHALPPFPLLAAEFRLIEAARHFEPEAGRIRVSGRAIEASTPPPRA